jgi:O-antigen/teichoic acid export membrane protein
MMNSDITPAAIPEPGSGETGGAARRVAINAFNPFAAQVFTKLLMMGYGIVQYRALGAEAGGVLGNYFLAGYVLLYTSTISEWGLGTYLTREVAKERSSHDEVSKLFHRTLTLRLGISLALFLPVALLIALYLGVFNRIGLFGLTTEGAWAIAILTISLLPAAYSGTITSVLYAYERMSAPAVIGIGTSLLNVAFGIAAILLGWGVVGLAVAALLATCLTAIIFGVILRRNFPSLSLGLDLSGLGLDRATAPVLLKAGWPLMLNALLVGLFFRVDQFIIQPVVGGVGVERYQAAYGYLNFVLLITPAITLALFPRMARHAVNDRPRLTFEYTFILKALLLLSVPIIILTVWFAPLFITIVTGGKAGYLPDSAVALQILIFFLPFSFVNGVTQYVLIALDKQKLITVAFAVTVVFNVAANLILIPWLGINGAAIATVLSEIVLLGPFVWWANRELGAVPLLSLVWRPLAAGAAAALLGWLLLPFAQRWQAGTLDFVLFLAMGGLLAVAYLAVLLALRPFTSSELSTLRTALWRGR